MWKMLSLKPRRLGNRKRNPGERGFALIGLVLIVAMISLAAANGLELVKLDLALARNYNLGNAGLDVAEGGLMEAINDTNTTALMPALSSSTLTAAYTPASGTPFNNTATQRQYTGTLRLLRVISPSETSALRSKALIYSIEVSSRVGKEEGGADVSAEVFQTIAYQEGLVLPTKYGK